MFPPWSFTLIGIVSPKAKDDPAFGLMISIRIGCRGLLEGDEVEEEEEGEEEGEPVPCGNRPSRSLYMSLQALTERSCVLQKDCAEAAWSCQSSNCTVCGKPFI